MSGAIDQKKSIIASRGVSKTMTNSTTPLDCVDELFAAIGRKDFTVFERVFTKDALIWHNTDSLEMTVPDVVAALAKISKLLIDWKYYISARIVFPGGVVQQHVVKMTLSEKAVLEFPACLVIKIRDGKISRIDEYFDASAAYLLNRLTLVE